MDKNRKKLLITLLIILGVGIAYYLVLVLTPLYIPCAFRSVTGLKCPGCGISGMLVNISKLRFSKAFLDNPFLFITGPFLIFEIIWHIIAFLKNKKIPKANNTVLIIYIVFLVAFGILRNIFGW